MMWTETVTAERQMRMSIENCFRDVRIRRLPKAYKLRAMRRANSRKQFQGIKGYGAMQAECICQAKNSHLARQICFATVLAWLVSSRV